MNSHLVIISSFYFSCSKATLEMIHFLVKSKPDSSDSGGLTGAGEFPGELAPLYSSRVHAYSSLRLQIGLLLDRGEEGPLSSCGRCQSPPADSL